MFKMIHFVYIYVYFATVSGTLKLIPSGHHYGRPTPIKFLK